MANKTINVTSISQIVRCNKDEYNQILSGEEGLRSLVPIPEYVLFIVSNESSNNTLEVYYGSRKLKDIIVVDSLPSGRDYPNNKLYIREDQSGNIRDLLYKVDDKLFSVTEKLLVRKVTMSSSLINVIWNEDYASNLVILSSNGEATDLIKGKDGVSDTFVRLVQSKYSVKWEVD